MYEEVALKTAEDVAKIVTKVKDLEGPKVISIFHSPKSMSANLSGTLTGAIMKDLGADNFADAWENKESKSRLPFNLEQLVAGNPKHILIQSHTDEEKAKTAIAEQYGEDAVWNSINAVKEGNVHYLQRELFHYRPNNKYSQSYKIVAKILYPDLTFED
jgi:iron complex transport system substrate-binding protein